MLSISLGRFGNFGSSMNQVPGLTKRGQVHVYGDKSVRHLTNDLLPRGRDVIVP